MATVSAKVYEHYKKADGTYHVKICVYHKGKRKDNAFISIKVVDEAKPLLEKYVGNLRLHEGYPHVIRCKYFKI